MNLVNVKAWQWMAAGLALGALVGYAWVGEPGTMPRSGNEDRFRALVRNHQPRAAQGKVAALRDVTVYPPGTDPSGTLVYPLTYASLEPDRAGKPTYVPSSLYAQTPYAGEPSVLAFLDRAQVPYADRYSGAGQYVPVAYGAGGGFVLVGLLWPGLVRLLVSAGYVPEPIVEPKPAGPSWWRRRRRAAKPKAAAGNAGDARALDALNDDIESRLMKGLAPGAARPGAAVASESASVPSSGQGSTSTDPTAAGPHEPDQPKDFKGEWYPVARPAAKRDEAH